MTIRLTIASFGLAAALLGAARADEHNNWPGPVAEIDAAGKTTSWTGLGPFLFNDPTPEGGRVSGFRPFYVKRTNPDGETAEITSLYPLFFYRSYGDTSLWSIFDLINWTGRRPGAPAQAGPPPGGKSFDVWPFYFSRQTTDPETSYRGLLPIAGSVQSILGYDKISWTLFPLYVQTEKKGAVTTSTPWPIVRSTRGAEQGFAIWPLFGSDERPGVFKRQFWLWPFFYSNTVQPGPDAPAGTAPTKQLGILPFYASVRGPDYSSTTFVGPFFGTADRTAPYHYHETDYFWPLFVQGRGDERYVNRWAPFYTHSEIKGMNKTWFLWPLWRQQNWSDSGLLQTKSSLLWFFYWHQEQQSLSNPALHPASKTYVWPLISTWDNGAGRRQIQIFSPWEGVFTDNREMREAWSPLVAIYRYNQRSPGEDQGSLLWNAVTWAHSASEQSSEFHVGPLVSREVRPDSGRVAIGNGIIGWKRGAAGSPWRLFVLEFPAKANKVAAKGPLKTVQR